MQVQVSSPPGGSDPTKLPLAGGTMTGTLVSLAQQYNNAASPGAGVRSRHTDGAGLSLFDNVASGGSHYRTVNNVVVEQVSAGAAIFAGVLANKPPTTSVNTSGHTTVGSVSGYAGARITVMVGGISAVFDWDGSTLTFNSGSTVFGVTTGVPGAYNIGVGMSGTNVQVRLGGGLSSPQNASVPLIQAQ